MRPVPRRPIASIRTLVMCAALGAGCATAPAPGPPVGPTSVAAPVAPPAAPPLPDVVFRAGQPAWGALVAEVVVEAPAAAELAIDGLSRTVGLPAPIGRAVVEEAEKAYRGIPVTREMIDAVDPGKPVVDIFLSPGIGVVSGD